MFSFFFFPVLNTKNTENIKFKKQEQFLENTKMIFFIFSKIVLLNNSFKKYEPSIYLVEID